MLDTRTLLLSGQELLSRAVRKERAPVDVRDFGVDLSGGSDDTSRLNLAIAQSAADGRRLLIPGGVISCANVLLKSGAHIVGDGSRRTTLRMLPDVNLPLCTSYDGTATPATDVTIEGVTFDGDQLNATAGSTAALLHAYNAARWHLSRVRFMNARGYGLGWQGYPTAPDATRRGPQTDLYVEFCEFLNNGYINGTPSSMDGVDIKHCERATFVACLAMGNSDKGFNVRGRYAEFFGCRSLANTTGFDCNSNNSPTDTDDVDSYFLLSGCAAEGNTGSGFAASATEDSTNRLAWVGCTARKNAAAGFFAPSGSSTGKVQVAMSSSFAVGNTSHGLQVTNAQVLSVDGLVTHGNGGDGVRLANQAGGRLVIDSQGNTGYGLRTTGTCSDLDMGGSVLVGNTAGAHTGTGWRTTRNMRGALSSVTAAAALTLPPQRPVIEVRGTTGITSISPTWDGDTVTLRFAHATTVTDGSNLKLAGNLTAAPLSTLSLVCDGANWLEVARSVN